MNNNQNTIQLTQTGNPEMARDLVKVRKITKRSISKFLLVTLIGILIFFIGATASLIAYQYAYAEKVAPNVFLVGKSISGLSKNSLDRQLTQLDSQFKSQKVKLLLNKDLSTEATLAEMGLTLDSNKTFANIWQVGRDQNLVNLADDLLSGSLNPTSLKYEINIDNAKLTKFIEDNIETKLPKAVDAKIDFQNNALILTNSQTGLTTDKSATATNLIAMAKSANFNDFTVSTTESDPNLQKEDVEPLKQTIEAMINDSFTLHAGTKSLKIQPADLFKMLNFKTVDKKLTAEVNTAELESYIKANEKKLVIVKVDKQIIAGSNIVIREGKNGQKINRDEVATLLNSALSAKLASKPQISNNITVSTIEEQFAEQIIDPASLVAASALSSAMPTGKSVVVDVSEQRLSAFENGQLVNSFLVSTGVPSHETPRGTFSITDRVYNKWYKGTNSNGRTWSYPNTLYNMRFKPSFYLHGAYWHSNWGHKMSHGCVNISYTNAEWLWNWSEIGTPVIVQD